MVPKSPLRWAADIRVVLRAVLGRDDAFPVDIGRVALECSPQWFPADPVSRVTGDDLPGFDGALIRDPGGRRGWMILYDWRVTSPGRQRFTVAHEFGHYLLHREWSPGGFHCRGEDFVRSDPAYRAMEAEANTFAANVLMPLDDFRAQVSERDSVDFDRLSACADRYGVSLVAVALRWLEYTQKRAMLVLAREGFVLWSWSSEAAFRSGLFFKTVGRPPLEVPPASLAAMVPTGLDGCVAERHPEEVWFPEECRELILPSERYDFSISLLLFSNVLPDWGTQQANRARALGLAGAA
jgi:hypothetical protein